MANFPRSTWITIFFLALIAPFLVVLALRITTPPPQTLTAATTQAAADTAPFGGILVPPTSTAPAIPGTAESQNAALFAAGDGKTLWVVLPVIFDKNPSYELLQRAGNTGLWAQAHIDDGLYASGFPQGLAVSSLEDSTSGAAAYVFADGSFTRFTLDDHDPRDCLPRDHTLLAETAGPHQIFALTAGAQPPSIKHAGDRLLPYSAVAATEPAFDVPPEPATAQSQPAPSPLHSAGPSLVNAFAFDGGHWFFLPPLGRQPLTSTEEVPGPHAFVALATAADRLIVMWVDPGAPSTLVARSLEYAKKDAAWSKPVASRLIEPLPPSTRLMPVVLDRSLYLFWPVISPQAIILRGGSMVTSPGSSSDLTLPPRNFLPALNLGTPFPNEDPTDITVGPTENSLAVITSNKDGSLLCQLFNQRGESLNGPLPVQASSQQHEVQIAQNIAMLVMILVLALSLWQWRQRPMTLKLPTDMEVAPLHMRALGFAIDFGIPLLVITAIFNMVDANDYSELLATWFAVFTNPEELLNSPVLMYVLARYLLHVTIGELFFRRSIGKAILGMEVLMIDGRAPTVAAVLLRNLVRIPELLSGILVFYMFISEHHQRLGDLFSRTLVVSAKAPETPEDPDAKEEEKESVASGKKDDSP